MREQTLSGTGDDEPAGSKYTLQPDVRRQGRSLSLIVGLLAALGSSSSAAAQAPGSEQAPPAAPPAEPSQPQTPSPQPPSPDATEPAASPPAEDALQPPAAAPEPLEPPVADVEDDAAVAAEVIAEPAASDPGEVVVTGSRIRVKSAFAASAPVEVLDRKQLEQAGITTVADVVQNLTIAPGSGFQGEGQGSRQGRIGVTGVDLRGLGYGATLVLVNGRRLPISGGAAPGGGGATSDLSQIPMLAIERIEILKGGASAIYGSDAVAGVVNVITRKNWNGFRFEAEGESDDSFDYKSYNLGATFGASADDVRVTGTVQWDLHTELDTNQRDWTTNGQLWSPVGYPGTFLVGGMTMPDPDCTRAGGRSKIIEMPGQMGPSRHCAFNDRDFQVLVPAEQRANAFLSADYDLTDHTTAFIESNYSRMRGDSILWPFFVLPPFSTIVPADHVDNPFGQEVRYNGRITDQPSRLGSDDDTLRLVAGLKGDLGGVGDDTPLEDWEWELAVNWGVSRYKATLADNIRPEVQAAINACSDPTNLRNCFNPFFSSRLGSGTANSDAVLQRIQGESVSTTDSGLRSYGAGLNGSLFELPGGDAGFALGGEIRHEWRHSDVDHDANLFDYGLRIGNTDYDAERDVYGGYLELRWPLYDGIEVQTAGRVDYYTDIDKSAANPTLGLTIIPSEIAGRENTAGAFRRLQLRAHASTAFRAPEVLDASRNSVAVPTQMQIGPGLPSYIPVRTSGNPELDHERALALSAGFVWPVIDELSLLAEFWYFRYEDRIGREDPRQKIDAWLAETERRGAPVLDFPGVIVDPATGAVSEVQVKLQNTRGTTLTHGFDFGAMVTLTGETFGGSRADWGTLSFGAQGSYVLAYEIPRHAVLPAVIQQGIIECDGRAPDSSCSVVGNRNFNNIAPPLPALRANFPVTWVFGGHAVNVIGRYLGPLEDDHDAGRAGDFSGEIDVFFTLDLQYSYTIEDWIGEALTFRVGITNVTDQDPPIVTTETAGFDPMLHDPRGRLVYAKLISGF